VLDCDSHTLDISISAMLHLQCVAVAVYVCLGGDQKTRSIHTRNQHLRYVAVAVRCSALESPCDAVAVYVYLGEKTTSLSHTQKQH